MKSRSLSLLVVTVVALVACSSHSSRPAASRPSAPASTSTPSPSKTAILSTRVVATRPSFGAGLPLLVGFGNVWSASSKGLIRFTPSGIGQQFLDKPVHDIAISSDAVVVLSDAAPLMLAFDPGTLAVMRQWQLAGAGVSVTTSGDVAYVVEGTAPARIVRIDLASGATTTRVLPSAAIPAADRSIAVGDGSVWFAARSHIYQLDPRSLATVRSVTSPISLAAVWYGDDAVWVSDETPGGGVARLDPSTGKVERTMGPDAIQITFTPQHVWLAAAAGATALRPATGDLVGAIPSSDVPDDSSAGIAVVGPNLWVAYGHQNNIQILHISGS